MNIRLFFEISKVFFDLMYSPFIEDIIDNEIILEKLDEEKGWEELSDDEDEEICDCNLCNTTRKILLFINPGIYKKLNANKID